MYVCGLCVSRGSECTHACPVLVGRQTATSTMPTACPAAARGACAAWTCMPAKSSALHQPPHIYAWTACKQQCKFKGLQFELLDWYCRVCNAELLHCSAPIDVSAHVPPQVKLAVGRASPRTCTATCTDIDTSGRGWQPYHNKYLCMHRHLDMHLHEFDFEPHSISIAPAAAVHRHVHHRAAELEL